MEGCGRTHVQACDFELGCDDEGVVFVQYNVERLAPAVRDSKKERLIHECMLMVERIVQ